jgi:hypothetical protein
MNNPTWTDILQTVAVVAALLFTGWEMRARRREQRFRNYLDAISGFVNLATLMVEKKELHAIYEYSDRDIKKTYDQLSSDEKARVHYCDTIIALCETVWLAAQEGWLSKDEWSYWKLWTDQLNKSAEFRWTLDWVRGDYDEEFRKVLLGKKEKKGSQT